MHDGPIWPTDYISYMIERVWLVSVICVQYRIHGTPGLVGVRVLCAVSHI